MSSDLIAGLGLSAANFSNSWMLKYDKSSLENPINCPSCVIDSSISFTNFMNSNFANSLAWILCVIKLISCWGVVFKPDCSICS